MNRVNVVGKFKGFDCGANCWGVSSIVLFTNSIPTRRADIVMVASLLLVGYKLDSVIYCQICICLILLNPRVSNSCSRMQNGIEHYRL